MDYQKGPVRELTLDERFKWGECPACGAKHGEYCHSAVGIQMGVKVDGSRMRDSEGAHLGRIRLAPLHVQEVPVNAG